jgi:hypothetical protein
MRQLTLGLAALALFLSVSGLAAAHPVGTPGEPQCYGERVSHGNWPQDPNHGITPVERAAFLTQIIAEDTSGFGALLRSLFGDTVSVEEFHTWVKLNCEPA